MRTLVPSSLVHPHRHLLLLLSIGGHLLGQNNGRGMHLLLLLLLLNRRILFCIHHQLMHWTSILAAQYVRLQRVSSHRLLRCSGDGWNCDLHAHRSR